MARKKLDMGAAQSLAGGIGRSGFNPSEALLMGASTQDTQNALDTQDKHNTHQLTSRSDGKRKRINMAFTDENMADMRLAASAYGVSQTEFTNRVLREWFDSHETELAAFRSARAKLESA